MLPVVAAVGVQLNVPPVIPGTAVRVVVCPLQIVGLLIDKLVPRNWVTL